MMISPAAATMPEPKTASKKSPKAIPTTAPGIDAAATNPTMASALARWPSLLGASTEDMRYEISFHSITQVANAVPRWKSTLKERPGAGKLSAIEPKSRCPELDTGKNSVRP